MSITETDISNQIGRTIDSSIRVSNLNELLLNQEEFLKFASPLFQELPWDSYEARRKQVEFLIKKFPKSTSKIQNLFKDYFYGKTSKDVFEYWIGKLNKKSTVQFNKIQPTRKYAVAQFQISETKEKIQMLRKVIPQFNQTMNSDDFQSFPEIYEESPSHHVENIFFLGLLGRIFNLVQEVESNVNSITVTSHFVSEKAFEKKSTKKVQQTNADSFISELVINRRNIKGGESQIIENLKNKNKETIFKKTLESGEFIFQLNNDSQNNLWHYITPIQSSNSKKEGWRDCIRFDISVNTEK